MQPITVALGLTMTALALAALLAGPSFAYLAPHTRVVLSQYWPALTAYAALALVSCVVALYATARAVLIAVGLVETPLLAQGVSPWLNAVDVLQQAFTGPLARGLSLIAIVIGGLMFAFGEGGSKKALAGIIFGLGMAMGAANFLTWLFS